MKASGLTTLLALWLGLSASAALAQEIAIPDTQQLQTMSIEEYETYREQMRSRMEDASPTERDPEPEPHKQAEKRNTGSGYGQGYGTRNGQGGMQGRQGSGYGRGGGGGRRR